MWKGQEKHFSLVTCKSIKAKEKHKSKALAEPKKNKRKIKARRRIIQIGKH